MGHLEQIILAVKGQGEVLRESRDGEWGIGEIHDGAGGGISHLDQALFRGGGGDGPFISARSRQAGGELTPGPSAVGGEEKGHMPGQVFRDPLDGFDAASLKAFAPVGSGQSEGGLLAGGAHDMEEGVAEIDGDLRICSFHLDQARVGEGFRNDPGPAAGVALAGGDFRPGGSAIEAEIERDRLIEAGAAPGDLGGVFRRQGLAAIGGGDSHHRRGVDDIERHPVDIHRTVAKRRGDANDALLGDRVGHAPDEGTGILHILIDEDESTAIIQRVLEVDQGAHVERFPGDLEGSVADDGDRPDEFGRFGEIEPLIGLRTVKIGARIVGEGDAVDAAVALAAADFDKMGACGQVEGGGRGAVPLLHGLLPVPPFIGGHIDCVFRTTVIADEDRVSGFTFAHHTHPEVIGGAGCGDVYGNQAAPFATAGVLG